MTLSTARWRPLIDVVAAEAPPLPADVLEAMILVESNGDPNARSASDARGLGQIIYRWHTALVDRIATELHVEPGPDALYNPAVNLDVTALHLRWCFISDGSQSWERAIRKYHSGTADPPADFEDGQGTSSDQHIAKYRAALVAVRADRTPPPPKEPSMGMKAHTWPGLGKQVYLPDWIPVEIRIIDHARFRSFQKSTGHTRTTFHDTGNPNTNADAEYRWAAAGREGAGVGGYNGIFDDKKIIITQPFDEVVWAAGTPEGNRTSYHFEMAWGAGVNFAKALEIGEALHGGICAAKGWSVDTALVQHHYWYGKHCPGQIRNRGLWSQVVAATTAAAAASRAAAGGSPGPAPVPTEKPVIIPELDAVSKSDGLAPSYVDASGTRWFWVGDRVKVTKPTSRFQRASKTAAKVGADFKVGEEFDLDWITDYEGAVWGYTPAGTRVDMTAVERISDTKGELEVAA